MYIPTTICKRNFPSFKEYTLTYFNDKVIKLYIYDIFFSTELQSININNKIKIQNYDIANYIT